jgi:putative phosphoesterase
MIIPIISDSHGSGYKAEIIFERLRKCGDYPRTAVFLGDGARDVDEGIPSGCELWSVAGNCDAWTLLYNDDGSEIPDERVEFVGGLKIFMTHGHKYSVKSGLGFAIGRARTLGADILLFGHTHEPISYTIPADDRYEKPLYVFNPGSLREGSFGLLTIKDGKPLFSHGKLF